MKIHHHRRFAAIQLSWTAANIEDGNWKIHSTYTRSLCLLTSSNVITFGWIVALADNILIISYRILFYRQLTWRCRNQRWNSRSWCIYSKCPSFQVRYDKIRDDHDGVKERQNDIVCCDGTSHYDGKIAHLRLELRTICCFNNCKFHDYNRMDTSLLQTLIYLTSLFKKV
jgi:hypothetical protein